MSIFPLQFALKMIHFLPAISTVTVLYNMTWKPINK